MADYITTLDQTSNILWEIPSAVDDITLNHLQMSKIFSFNGTIDSDKRYVDGIGISIKNNYQLKRPELHTLYSFWQARDADYNKFYLPIYETFFDLTRTVNSGDIIIYLKHIPYLANWLAGTYIWLKMKNGDRIVRKVISITDLTTEYSVTLDTGMPAYGFVNSDIGFAGRFILSHFATKDFDIDYLLKDYGTVTLIFHQIVTVDTENPAIYAELYTITTPLSTGCYTSYYKDISYNNQTYLAAVVKRSSIKYSLDIKDNSSLNITMYPTTYVKQNIFEQPLSKVNIRIDRLDIISNTFSHLYQGHIAGISMAQDLAVINMLSKDEALTFNIPRVLYQSVCNNQLFDSYCKVVSANYSEVPLVQSISGNSLTLVESTIFSDGYFTGGYAKYNNEYRFITNYFTGVATIIRPFSVDVTNKNIILYAGCDKAASTCLNKFNNIINFRGFPYIPSKNPTLWGV